ncbi:serine-rich adhesin for platelets-like [Rhipicephalus sanguineus]|uniref:serine-rich adhesin for platelets-like n=1 Tax=Rhipicephalus sanguineus TaxID=34632 RepID=UPI0020C28778|nr:serine-rich adhesin for platelets-like [Rhipicephalus sanguineus]
MTNASHEGSTRIAHGHLHTSDATSKTTSYSTEKTAQATTTVSHHASTTNTSAISTSAALVTEQASSTTTGATISSKTATSTHALSTATEKLHPSANKSDNMNEHDSFYGSKEGAVVNFTRTSTEKSTKLATIGFGTPENEKNVSSSATMETVSLDTVKITHKSHTDATTSTSVSGSSISETSNSSRTILATTSQAATSTDNTAIRTDRIYTNATFKPNGFENNGSRHTSTTRSYSTSINESTKQASLESHISENTNIVSNLPTVESVNLQTADVTHQPITYITDSSQIATESDADQTQNNQSVLTSTSVASATDKKNMATGTDQTATRNASIDHIHNATTASPVTGSVSIYTNAPTGMSHGYFQIYENSSRASNTSTGQAGAAQTTNNATRLENTDETTTSVITRTSVTTLRNTSESLFTSTSTSSGTHVQHHKYYDYHFEGTIFNSCTHPYYWDKAALWESTR